MTGHPVTKRRGEKRLTVQPHSWSKTNEPKVHRYLYDSLNKDWFPACTMGRSWRQYHGTVTDDVDLPVTCKLCGLT